MMANRRKKFSTRSTVRNLFQSADRIVTESNSCASGVYAAQNIEGIKWKEPAFVLKECVTNDRKEQVERTGNAPASETATERSHRQAFPCDGCVHTF